MILPNISFQVLSFIYLTMISLLFFTKKKIKNKDTEIYTYLIIVNFLILIIDITSVFVLAYSHNQFLLDFTCKGYLVGLIIWVDILTDYVWLTIWDKRRKMTTSILIVLIMIIQGVIIFMFPLEYYWEGPVLYIAQGGAIYVAYTMFILCALVWGINVLVMHKKIPKEIIREKNKRLYPVFLFVFFGIVGVLTQKMFPQLVVTTSVLTLATILMYHTIENPDVDTIKILDKAKKQAEENSKAKTDFLSSMSHEIRTPLNAIIGFSNFIIDCDNLEDAKANATDVVTASTTLLETVNGILDISKVESGKMEVVNDNYNFIDLLDETVKLANARLGDKPLELITNFDPNIPHTLYGDKSIIYKIIINILTNAIKYTNEGTINYNVSGISDGEKCKITVSVKDTGIGIKEEDLKKIFNKFQRVDEKKNKSIEGTGLGMAITKELLDLIGGSIAVESTYGKGSTFTVSFEQVISTVSIANKKVVVEEESKYDFSDKNILVVDDNNLNLKLASKLFKRYNCEIQTVKSGFECLDLIEKGNKYDIIFLDDVMPVMLGSETVTRLKRIEGFKTPVVSLTANAIEGVKEKYLSLGFDDYLAKPIEKSKLEDILVKFLVNKTEAKSISSTELKSSNPVELVNETVKEQILNSPSAKDININAGGSKMDDNIFGKAVTNNVGVEVQSSNTDEGKTLSDYSDKRVLVVDDNKLNLKVAIKFLERYHFQTDEAYSGEDCLAKVQQGEKYDIIFMDIMMPTLNGVETFHRLKEIEGFSVPVVIALTADAVEGAKERYLAEGFAEYISKPIVREHLDQVLHKILDK